MEVDTIDFAEFDLYDGIVGNFILPRLKTINYIYDVWSLDRTYKNSDATIKSFIYISLKKKCTCIQPSRHELKMEIEGSLGNVFMVCNIHNTLEHLDIIVKDVDHHTLWARIK